jgi:hypothetical protein
MNLVPHDCLAADFTETWVQEGEFCPNGCGWQAVWNQEVEEYVIHKMEQAIQKWGPLIPLAEAARTTGYPLSTLAQAAREKRLPAIEVSPGHWLVRLSAVHAQIGLNPPGKRGRRMK